MSCVAWRSTSVVSNNWRLLSMFPRDALNANYSKQFNVGLRANSVRICMAMGRKQDFNWVQLSFDVPWVGQFPTVNKKQSESSHNSLSTSPPSGLANRSLTQQNALICNWITLKSEREWKHLATSLGDVSALLIDCAVQESSWIKASVFIWIAPLCGNEFKSLKMGQWCISKGEGTNFCSLLGANPNRPALSLH